MKTKRWIMPWILALLTLTLVGCGSTTPAPVATPTSAPAAVKTGSTTALDTTYENALPQRNQLLLGTLRLEESDWPISAEQARTLLPLWQGMRGAMNSGASAPAETDALLQQIEAALTADQIGAIREMKLTQAELQAWAKSQGLATGTGEGAGQGGGQQLSPEARATRQAERGGTSESGGLSRVLVDAVIELMASK